MKNTKTFFLLLTLALSVVLLSPYLSFQNILSTGDHGRDFYAFEEALHGKKPYLDYWWVYGPLMPAYYALFYKTLGIHMSSILVGKILLQTTGALFFYLGAQTIMPPVMACLASLWLISFMQDFFMILTGGMPKLIFLIEDNTRTLFKTFHCHPQNVYLF